MAQRCEVCGKGPVAGKSISHSHKTSNRRFLPNVQRVKLFIKGSVQHAKVCSRCLRSQRITKPPRRLVAA